MRIGFFWTPHLAARVLEDILNEGNIEVVFVVTNPDKPVGRDQVLKPTPVKELALSDNIPVFTPIKVRENTELFDTLRAFNCDYFIVVAYGRILPKEILDMPRKMCINVHGSILPKYRGASPIQSALLHGEKETGVTIMQMSEGMDEGDILSIEKIAIDQSETSWSLFEKFENISGKALIETIMNYESWLLNPTPQGHWIPAYAGMTEAPEPTYCTKIEKEDGLIDWSQSAEQIYHQWQAYTPWPGIFTMYEEKRLLLEKISVFRHREEWSETERRGDLVREKQVQDCFPVLQRGRLKPRNDDTIWKIINLENEKIGVVCGEWILILEQVKLEWKKSQSIKDFVNGNQGLIDYRF
jgi:methionyl-tRNA formyltransferase